MGFEEWVSSLIGSKPLMVVLAIFAVLALILIIPSIIIVWAYGFMTGAVFFIAGLIFLFALHKMEILDTEKYPWVIFMPIGLGVVGIVVEKYRLFSLQPISLSSFALTNGVAGFINAETMLLGIIVILLAIGLVKK